MIIKRRQRQPSRALVLLLVAAICLAVGYVLGGSSQSAFSATSSTAASVSAGGDAATSRASSSAAEAGSGGNASGAGGGGGVKTVCEDTCPGRARDGVCNEGRPHAKADAPPEKLAVFEVDCDLGTDCSDCGPWVHTNTDASDAWRPIEEIRAKKYPVLTRRTAHPTGFFAAYTSPALDVDASSQLADAGALLEPGFTWVWHRVLSEACPLPGSGGSSGGGGSGSGEAPLILDVGANFGYYSLLAAALGCRVVAWEPVPHFAAYFKYALLRNNFTHAVELRERIVSNSSGVQLTMEVPQRGIWGTAGIGGHNIDRAIDNEGEYERVTRQSELVDEVVAQDVLLMKIDVEGFEPQVLQGSKQLLLQHDVRHIIMEYSPGVAERSHDWHWFGQNPARLMGLLQHNYTILHVGLMALQWPKWEPQEPLPAMDQVTAEVLRHDLWDAQRLQDGTLGCHGQEAEDELQPTTADGKSFMFGCGAIPEGLDPQSLRSSFSHNTNLWAFRGDKPWYATVGNDTAGIAPLDFDVLHEYFTPGGAVGSGYRLCKDLDIGSQVAHRCPCADPGVCGALESKVAELAKRGLLPPFPLEPDPVRPQDMRVEAW